MCGGQGQRKGEAVLNVFTCKEKGRVNNLFLISKIGFYSMEKVLRDRLCQDKQDFQIPEAPGEPD